jgi:hypothetical protein
MRDAEQALKKAAADLPAEFHERCSASEKLNDGDRKAILQVVNRVLEPFWSEPTL